MNEPPRPRKGPPPGGSSRSDPPPDGAPRHASPGAVVVLVGLMGAGKSTVGRILADRWGCPFLDLDEEIERRAGTSVAEIFRREGEEGFRRREAEATHGLRPRPPLVIATGGGWMARPELRDAWAGAIRVWLQVTPGEALDRLRGLPATRPLLANESPGQVLETLLERRSAAYRLAEIAVATSGLDVPETAAAVAEAVEDMANAAGRADPADRP